MVRTKRRSKTPFIGRRKKAGMRRLKISLEKDSAVLGESRKLSASASKMSSFGLTLENLMESRTIAHHGKSIEDEDSFLLVQVLSLSKLFSSLLCPHCFHSGLTFELSPIKSHGFAFTGKGLCPSCDIVVKQQLCVKSQIALNQQKALLRKT